MQFMIIEIVNFNYDIMTKKIRTFFLSLIFLFIIFCNYIDEKYILISFVFVITILIIFITLNIRYDFKENKEKAVIKYKERMIWMLLAIILSIIGFYINSIFSNYYK